MQKKVSLIVTVFNKKDTIQKCLISIKKQSYKKINVIVIDDGSTDNSGEIAKRICKTDNRFKYYYQQNKGVSSARNMGLDKAEGESVLFIDGDDFIDSDYVERIARYQNFDITVAGFKVVGRNDVMITSVKPKNMEFNMNSLDIFFNEKTFKFIGVPYSKLFKLNIIRKNKIKFDVTKDFGEDTEFVFDYLLKCKKVKYISYTGYNNYIYLADTLSRKTRLNVWEVNKKLVDSLTKRINLENNKSWTFLYMRAISLSLRSCSNNNKAFNRTWLKIRKDNQFNKLKINNISTNSKKILFVLLVLNVKKVAYFIYNKKTS